MKSHWCWMVVLCGALVWSCGGEANKSSSTTPDKKEKQGPPIGTWYLYAGSDSGTRTESMDTEVTILVLEDSTYTLTLMQAHKQLNFVEKGSVSFNERSKSMDFLVYSSIGVDFSGAEPRKLIDVEQVVPWERAPGTVYKMEWRTEWQHDEASDIDREVMVLAAPDPDQEDSYFVRLENRDAGSSDLDAKLAPQKN
jgi:hypothetical protein